MKRFQQILLNLLSNSLKFTFNGFIKIKTKSKIISDTNLISISVSDTGVGIKEENIKELFHAFGMLNDTKTINKYGNIYINLYIYIYIFLYSIFHIYNSIYI